MGFTVGWDVGGAHLKTALLDKSGTVVAANQRPCPLWQGLGQLDAAFADSLADLPNDARHAVTMTGELVDVFPNRKQGVVAIARACRRHLGDQARFWTGDGFVDVAQTERTWRKIASANWLATANLCAQQVPNALMMDMGSTTTDLVAIAKSKVKPQGLDDGDRLISGELVYGGVTRTPVMALGPKIAFQDQLVGVTAEHFATTADLYRLLDKPIHDHYPSADGQGKSAEDSARRLARMVGRDFEDFPLETWRELAQALHLRQLDVIETAARQVLKPHKLPAKAPVIGAGQGGFNAQALAQRLNRPYLPIGYLLRFTAAAAEMAETVVTAIAVASLL